jgi:hypothetical protein
MEIKNENIIPIMIDYEFITDIVRWRVKREAEGSDLYDKRTRIQDGFFEHLPATCPKGRAQRAH